MFKIHFFPKQSEDRRIALNTDTAFLKIIGLLTMTIDHIGRSLFPSMVILRSIGRIALPIFAYCITVGFLYTRDVKKYLVRLMVFAVISQPIYALRAGIGFQGYLKNLIHLNIFFTLALGLCALWALQEKRWGVFILILAASVVLPVDYNTYGVLLVVLFYLLREQKALALAVSFLYLAVPFLQEGAMNIMIFGRPAYIQGFAVLALPFLAVQTHVPLRLHKYFFYCYYPVHLLILYGVECLMKGGFI